MHAYICTYMEVFLSCSYPWINIETSVNYKCPGNDSDLLWANSYIEINPYFYLYFATWLVAYYLIFLYVLLSQWLTGFSGDSPDSILLSLIILSVSGCLTQSLFALLLANQFLLTMSIIYSMHICVYLFIWLFNKWLCEPKLY